MQISQLSVTSVAAPSRGRMTVLVSDPERTDRYITRSVGIWGRFLTRIFAFSLDRQLADGRSAESSRCLATRARTLVSPKTRRDLAENLEHLLAVSRRPQTVRTGRAPLRRERIVAVESEVQEMLTMLLSPLPTPARGVAMANLLLGDGAGPLWNHHCPTDLAAAVRQVTAHLDPAVPLLQSS